MPGPASLAVTGITALAGNGMLLVEAEQDFQWGRFLLVPQGDTDGDGMADSFEELHGFAVFDASDGEEDRDADGLTNSQEAELGTHPDNPDSDGDQIRDDWEVEWGLNPLDAADAGGDPDGDHVSNVREFQIDTAPTGLYHAEEIEIPGLSDLTPILCGNDGMILVYGCSGESDYGYHVVAPDAGNPGAWTVVTGGPTAAEIETWQLAPYLMQANPPGAFHAFAWDANNDPLLGVFAPGQAAQFGAPLWNDGQESHLCRYAGAGSASGNHQLMLSWDLTTPSRLIMTPDRVIKPLPDCDGSGAPQAIDWHAVDDTGRVLGAFLRAGRQVLVTALPDPATGDWITSPHEIPVPDDLSLWTGMYTPTSPSGRCAYLSSTQAADGSSVWSVVGFDPDAGTFSSTSLTCRHIGLPEWVDNRTDVDINDRGEMLTRRALIVGGSAVSLGRLWTIPADGGEPCRLEDQGYSTFEPARFDLQGRILGSATRNGNKVLLRISPVIDGDADGMPDNWEVSVIREFQSRGIAPVGQGKSLPDEIEDYLPADDLDGDGYSAKEEANAGMTDSDPADGNARDEIPFVNPRLWWKGAAASLSKTFAFEERRPEGAPMPAIPKYYLRKAETNYEHKSHINDQSYTWTRTWTYAADAESHERVEPVCSEDRTGDNFTPSGDVTYSQDPIIDLPTHFRNGGTWSYSNQGNPTASETWYYEESLDSEYTTAMLRADVILQLNRQWENALTGPWQKGVVYGEVLTHLPADEKSFHLRRGQYGFDTPDGITCPIRVAVLEYRRSIDPGDPNAHLPPPGDAPELVVREQYFNAPPNPWRSAPAGVVHDLEPGSDNRDGIVMRIVPQLTLTLPLAAAVSLDPPLPSAEIVDSCPVPEESALQWNYRFDPFTNASGEFAQEFRVPIHLELVSGAADSLRLWEPFEDGTGTKWRLVHLPAEISPSSATWDSRRLLIESLGTGTAVFRISLVTDSGLRLAARSKVLIAPVDIDIDSDNSGEIDANAAEDQIEDLFEHPGKLLSANTGICPAVPVQVTFAAEFPDDTVSFWYAGSDPSVVDADGRPYPGLRLWTAQPGPGAFTGTWIEPGREYLLGELGLESGTTATFWLDAVGNIAGQESIWVYVSDSTRLVLGEDRIVVSTIDLELVPDFNRDGAITAEDRGRATKDHPWRFWCNDDNDFGVDGGDDLPQEYPNENPFANTYGPYASYIWRPDEAKPVPDTMHPGVDGIRDLIDFFPLHLDLASTLERFPASDYTYYLKTAEPSTNEAASPYHVVWYPEAILPDEDTENAAGAYLTNPTRAQNIASRQVHPIAGPNGLQIPTSMLAAAAEGKGVVLVEATRDTDAGLAVRICRANGAFVVEGGIAIQIAQVEDMFRHKDLRDVPPQADQKQQDDRCEQDQIHPPAEDRAGMPVGLPDNYCNEDWFVFLHGYNVNGENARGWHSEFFKRMFQSGSHARFYAVSWYGDETQVTIFGNRVTPKFYENDENALGTSSALKDLVNDLPGGKKYLAGQSLGAMVVADAVANHGAVVEKAFLYDPAMATESLLPKSAISNDVMMEPEGWRTYPETIKASEYYRLFPAADARSNLTWRGEFHAAVPKLCVYFSSGEEVLAALPTSQPADPGWLGNEPQGQFAYAVQAMTKGLLGAEPEVPQGTVLGWLTSEMTHLVEGASPASDHGGWRWTDGIEDLSWFGEDWSYLIESLWRRDPSWFLDWFDSDDFMERLKRDPVFGVTTPEGCDGLFSATEGVGSSVAADVINRRRILAQMIPERSLPAGGAGGSGVDGEVASLKQKIAASGSGTIIAEDMQDMASSDWPDERTDGRWLHNDIREMAYLYVWEVFEKTVAEGELSQEPLGQ